MNGKFKQYREEDQGVSRRHHAQGMRRICRSELQVKAQDFLQSKQENEISIHFRLELPGRNNTALPESSDENSGPWISVLVL